MNHIAKPITILSSSFLLAVLLSGCGESRSDRALSGAGIGAGVGAVGGALVGGNPVGGAVLGGAAGAAAGGLTNSNNINLGRPLWR